MVMCQITFARLGFVHVQREQGGSLAHDSVLTYNWINQEDSNFDLAQDKLLPVSRYYFRAIPIHWNQDVRLLIACVLYTFLNLAHQLLLLTIM